LNSKCKLYFLENNSIEQPIKPMIAIMIEAQIKNGSIIKKPIIIQMIISNPITR
jgi:hypothetical protein